MQLKVVALGLVVLTNGASIWMLAINGTIIVVINVYVHQLTVIVLTLGV